MYFQQVKVGFTNLAPTYLLVGEEFPVLSAQEEVGCAKSSAINVYQWLREVCSTSVFAADCSGWREMSFSK